MLLKKKGRKHHLELERTKLFRLTKETKISMIITICFFYFRGNAMSNNVYLDSNPAVHTSVY